MGLNKGYLSVSPQDEYYTPKEAVEPIVKYLDRFKTVWCPFDTEDSQYTKVLKEKGYNVISTHIEDGYDFFEFAPENYDVIVSNPPFSIKDKVLSRLSELEKPFAILLPLPTLQGQKRFKVLIGGEALIFNKRINFYKDRKQKEMAKGVSFASIYFCKGVLPEKLIFEEI